MPNRRPVADHKGIFVSGVPIALVKALDEIASREGVTRTALLVEGARAALDRRQHRPVYKAARETDGAWSVGYTEGDRHAVVARGMSQKDARYVASALTGRES